MLVKFWDLDTKHCFKTIVSHRSEVNDLILLNDDQTLITGCHDNELRVFELKFKSNETKNTESVNDSENEEDSTSILTCNLVGSLIRESKDALNQICIDQSHSVFTSHSSNEKHLELYKINSLDEIKKRLAKKIKKQKRKLNNNKTTSENENNQAESDEDEVEVEQTVQDKFTRISMLKTKHKIKSVDILCEFNYLDSKRNKLNEETLFDCKLACLLHNNQIEVYFVKGMFFQLNIFLIYILIS